MRRRRRPSACLLRTRTILSTMDRPSAGAKDCIGHISTVAKGRRCPRAAPLRCSGTVYIAPRETSPMYTPTPIRLLLLCAFPSRLRRRRAAGGPARRPRVGRQVRVHASRCPPTPPSAQRSPPRELARYIEAMSGAEFPVRPAAATASRSSSRPARSSDTNLGGDGYAIAIRGDDVVLAADTDRAKLYAAYDLLERLGCRWLAPQFDFYNGRGGGRPEECPNSSSNCPRPSSSDPTSPSASSTSRRAFPTTPRT